MPSASLDNSARVDFAELGTIDTPTICNAAEISVKSDRRVGFLDGTIRCQFPELGVTVGRALTVTARNTPGVTDGGGNYWKLWQAVEDCTDPCVLVIADESNEPWRMAVCGEIVCRLASRLGAVGLVTDGSVRDLAQVRPLGFQLFSRWTVASHAYFEVCEIGVPVRIGGETVHTGQIVHGDENGIAIVPEDGVDSLVDAASRITSNEAAVLDYLKSPDFTLAGLRETWSVME